MFLCQRKIPCYSYILISVVLKDIFRHDKLLSYVCNMALWYKMFYIMMSSVHAIFVVYNKGTIENVGISVHKSWLGTELCSI